MKNVISTLAATTILLLSCSKDNDNVEPQVLGETGDRKTNSAAAVSNWTPVSNWSVNERNGMKVYTTGIADTRITGEVINKGAVVVFVKGTDFSGGNFDFGTNMIPWDQFIPWERMAYPYHWDTDVKEGQLGIVVRMHPDIEADYLKYRGNVQARYFILSEAFLKKHHLTAASVKEQSYQQLVAKTGTNP